MLPCDLHEACDGGYWKVDELVDWEQDDVENCLWKAEVESLPFADDGNQVIEEIGYINTAEQGKDP